MNITARLIGNHTLLIQINETKKFQSLFFVLAENQDFLCEAVIIDDDQYSITYDKLKSKIHLHKITYERTINTATKIEIGVTK